MVKRFREIKNFSPSGKGMPNGVGFQRRSMISALSEDESLALASRYDFSGGQIENIARHYAINKVLHGDDENRLDSLFSYCDGEKFEKKEQHKIGFV